jgi:hypothetical protein
MFGSINRAQYEETANRASKPATSWWATPTALARREAFYRKALTEQPRMHTARFGAASVGISWDTPGRPPLSYGVRLTSQ